MWNPVHHTTLDTSGIVPSAIVGFPSRTPSVRPTRWTPAARRSLPRVRISGVPLEMNPGRALRPIGVSTVSSR